MKQIPSQSSQPSETLGNEGSNSKSYAEKMMTCIGQHDGILVSLFAWLFLNASVVGCLLGEYLNMSIRHLF